MNIETIKIKKLKLDEKNVREHSERQIELLANSLDTFGQRKPIVINSKNVVVAGNGTLIGAEKLGWTTIQVVRVPNDWTQEKIRAFAIADNSIADLSSFDNQNLMVQLEDLKPVINLDNIGFDETALTDLQNKLDKANLNTFDELTEYEDDNKFILLVELENESKQQAVYNMLLEMGYECKILN